MQLTKQWLRYWPIQYRVCFLYRYWACKIWNCWFWRQILYFSVQSNRHQFSCKTESKWYSGSSLCYDIGNSRLSRRMKFRHLSNIVVARCACNVLSPSSFMVWISHRKSIVLLTNVLMLPVSTSTATTVVGWSLSHLLISLNGGTLFTASKGFRSCELYARRSV